MTINDVGPQHKIQRIMNQCMYKETLKEHLGKCMQIIPFTERKIVFHPIEHRRKSMGYKKHESITHKYNSSSSLLFELHVRIEEQCRQIVQDFSTRLVKSMPKRITVIIKTKLL